MVPLRAAFPILAGWTPDRGIPSRLIMAFLVLVTGAQLVACGSGSNVTTTERILLREGLELQQVPVRDLPGGTGDGLLTLAYFDPDAFELRLFTAEKYGGARPADRWLREFGLTAVVNASMYLPNHRSTGLMVDNRRFNNPAVNPSFGGFLAFDAVDSTAPAWFFAGEDCEGFDLDRTRAEYRVLVQNYRLLDCQGEPFDWKDSKAYSSAAIGRDRRGWLVFAHSGAACRTVDFARWLGDDRFGLTDAHFVEGGPDASLMVRNGSNELRVVGSWSGVPQGGFRDVPNVLGVVAKGRG